MAAETSGTGSRVQMARDLIARGRKAARAVKGAAMALQLLAAALIIAAEVRDQLGDREIPMVTDARSRVRAMADRLPRRGRRPATSAEKETTAEKR